MSKSVTSAARRAQDRVAEQADGLDGHGGESPESRRLTGRPGYRATRLSTAVERVDLDPHRVELAGRADPLQLAERVAQGGALRARHPDHGTDLAASAAAPSTGAGPSTSAAAGTVEQRERVVHRAGAPR